MAGVAWRELSLSNDRPPVAGGHASCISTDGTHLAIFGGCDPFGVATNALHLIALDTGRSELCDVGAAGAGNNTHVAPPKRSGHTMVTVAAAPRGSGGHDGGDDDDDDHMCVVIFGGVDFLPTCRVFSDVWLGTIRHRRHADGADAGASGAPRRAVVTWRPIETTAASPSAPPRTAAITARHSFASCVMAGPALFVFGGSTGDAPVAEAAVLDLAPLTTMTTPRGESDQGHEPHPLPVLAWHAVECKQVPVASEMCCACHVTGGDVASTAIVAGGRDASGNAVRHMYSCVPCPSSGGGGDPACPLPPRFVLRLVGSSPSLQRACASLLAFPGGRGVCLVGGVVEDPAVSALPIDVGVDFGTATRSVPAGSGDAAVAATVLDVARVRPVARMEGTRPEQMRPANFGIGQSFAPSLASTGTGAGGGGVGGGGGGGLVMGACVSGIFPNAVGHTTQVFVASLIAPAVEVVDE